MLSSSSQGCRFKLPQFMLEPYNSHVWRFSLSLTLRFYVTNLECNIYASYATELRLEISLILNAVRQCDKAITFHHNHNRVGESKALLRFTIFIADDKKISSIFSFSFFSSFCRSRCSSFVSHHEKEKHCRLLVSSPD